MSRLPDWQAASVAAVGALFAATARQVIGLLEPAGWSWTELLKDLVGNVFLVGLFGLLVEASRRFAKQRSTALLVTSTSPLVEKTVLVWGGDFAVPDDEQGHGDSERQPAFGMAEYTLNEIEQGLQAMLEASSGATTNMSIGPDAIRELGRYVEHGGRQRRAVHGRALMAELASARLDGDEQVAEAASAFVLHITDWLALLEQTDAAVRAVGTHLTLALPASKEAASALDAEAVRLVNSAVLIESLRIGEDPVTALHRALPRAAGDTVTPPLQRIERDVIEALQVEVVAAFACIQDLRDLFAAASRLLRPGRPRSE